MDRSHDSGRLSRTAEQRVLPGVHDPGIGISLRVHHGLPVLTKRIKADHLIRHHEVVGPVARGPPDIIIYASAILPGDESARVNGANAGIKLTALAAIIVPEINCVLVNLCEKKNRQY